MNTKFFKLTLCVLLTLSVAWLSGCEKMMDMAPPMDDEMVSTLKVGLIHPQANYPQFGKGVELAVAEINPPNGNGILGMPIELIYKEETTDTVVQSATDLVEMENVVAILGPLFSSHTVKVGPDATVPLILGATGAAVTSEENDPNKFLFLAASSNAVQAKLMADFVVNQLGKKTAAMIWEDKDVYSIGFVEAFEANFQDPELGGSILAKQTYEKGATMFDTQLAAIKEASPEVLLLASFAPANPLIMKQARGMGITSTFIGSDGWDDPAMLTTLEDNTPLEDSYYCTNFDPGAVEFNSAYEAMFGVPADGISATGYDAMRLLAMGIEMAQSTNPVAIRDAVASIADYKGATTIAGFDDNRHPIKPGGGIRVFQILNGKRQEYAVVTATE